MAKEYNVYHIYGTASKENPGPKVRKDNYPQQYEDSEINNNLLSITISSYGDAPDLAYIEIVAVDEHAGKRAFNRVIYDWQQRGKHAAWGQ